MTTANADTTVPPADGAGRGPRSPSRRPASRPARTLAWLAVIVSALLVLVWATALAASEGFTRPLSVVVFLVVAIASAAGLSFAVRTVRVVPAFVTWTLISALMTTVWVFMTGVDSATVTSVAALVVVIGVASGLQLLYRRRAVATS